MSSDYLLEKLDQVSKLVDGLNWVKEYQVYLQSQHSQRMVAYEDEIEQNLQNINSGLSLRLTSKNQTYQEFSLSLTEIDSIKELREGRSTQIGPESYKSLKRPHSSSISGDFSNSVDMSSYPPLEIHQQAVDIASIYEIPFSHRVDVTVENRVISSSGDSPVIENSLRTNYQVIARFSLAGNHYYLKRNAAGRSLDPGIANSISDLVSSCELRFKHKVIDIHEFDMILFHPDILTSILSSYFFYLNWELHQDHHMAADNIQIYDDPNQKGGYYSFLFDDEGVITNAKQLVADGRVVSSLSLPQDDGGHSYRVESYQPELRSFRYSLRQSATNLIITGGTGLGSEFLQRPGKVLFIRDGYANQGALGSKSDFLIHSSEAELWENGQFVGPIRNLSLTGNTSKLLHQGRFSSDLVMRPDLNFPITIFSGWIAVPPSLVSIRS